MSIASELNAMNGYILGAYDEINAKGGTIPTNKNMANLASAISSISGGGGGDVDISGLFGLTKSVSGTFSVSGKGWSSYDLTHNLGVTPKLVVFASNEVEMGDVMHIIGGFVLQTGEMLYSSRLMNSGIHIGGGASFIRTSDSSSYKIQSFCNVSTTTYKTSDVYDLYGDMSGDGGTSYSATSTSVSLTAQTDSMRYSYFAPNKIYHYLVAG